MSIETTLGRWTREATVGGLVFFGVMFILVGLFGEPGHGEGQLISVAIGVILLVVAAIMYQNNKKMNRIEQQTEGMTSIERKAYLEEKGRLAAQKDNENK